MQSNLVGDQTAEALAQALVINRSLTSLSLDVRAQCISAENDALCGIDMPPYAAGQPNLARRRCTPGHRVGKQYAAAYLALGGAYHDMVSSLDTQTWLIAACLVEHRAIGLESLALVVSPTCLLPILRSKPWMSR